MLLPISNRPQDAYTERNKVEFMQKANIYKPWKPPKQPLKCSNKDEEKACRRVAAQVLRNTVLSEIPL